MIAKLRCPSLTKFRHVRATVSPQRALLSKDEIHDGIRNGVFLNERCKPTQNPSGRYRPPSYHTSCSNPARHYCRRLLERYREHGPLSLVNRRRGQPGNRQLMPGLAERALRIIRERYADFGPTLACEKLAEVHGLYLAKETVRKLMTLAGLWIPRKLRPPRVHQPRPRRACLHAARLR